MSKQDVPNEKRRRFLKGATLAGAAALAAPREAAAQAPAPRNPVPLPNKVAETAPIPFAAFRNQLRRPADEMPPYVEAVLSDQDVADIFAYIQALPPPPDLKTIGILAN